MNAPSYEIPTEMRDFADKSVEQARKAFESFISTAQKQAGVVEGATNSAHTNVKDFSQKAFSYAEANMAAAFDHAQKLVRAKDIQEVLTLQSDFAKSQLQTIQEQAKDLGTVVQKSASAASSAAQTAASAVASHVAGSTKA